MKKLVPTTIVVLFAVILLADTGPVQAFDSFTGCLTPGGTIIHMSPGDSPLKPCKRNETLIHLQERINRTFDAHYDHDKICEAFHELALSPAALADLGCPSTPTLTKEGTLIRVSRDAMRGNNYNVCDILTIDQNPDFGQGWFWIVEEGFVAEKVTFPQVPSGDTDCLDKCNGDDKCIAANYYEPIIERDPKVEQATIIGICEIYHHSDSLKYSDAGFCGFTRDALLEGGNLPFDCTQNVATSDNWWWVRVPDGQTIDNCPGAPATP